MRGRIGTTLVLLLTLSFNAACRRAEEDGTIAVYSPSRSGQSVVSQSRTLRHGQDDTSLLMKDLFEMTQYPAPPGDFLEQHAEGDSVTVVIDKDPARKMRLISTIEGIPIRTKMSAFAKNSFARTFFNGIRGHENLPLKMPMILERYDGVIVPRIDIKGLLSNIRSAGFPEDFIETVGEKAAQYPAELTMSIIPSSEYRAYQWAVSIWHRYCENPKPFLGDRKPGLDFKDLMNWWTSPSPENPSRAHGDVCSEQYRKFLEGQGFEFLPDGLIAYSGPDNNFT